MSLNISSRASPADGKRFEATTSTSAIDHKRQLAQERAERIHDPKVRVIGIDKQALDEQVNEKSSLQDLEKQRNTFFDRQALAMDKHAQILQRQADNLRGAKEREIVEYRSKFQKKDASREWDMNDPKRVLAALPLRVSDDDPRCGPSSLQKFEGEDLDFQNRSKAQAEQMRTWSQQQQEEKLMKKWLEREHNRQYEDRAEEAAFRAWQIEQNIANQRKQASVTTAQFNKAMSEQKQRERLLQKHNDTQRNLEEIQNMMDSDILTENRDATYNAVDANRYKRDNFKGLSYEQRQNILDQQATQREQLRQRRINEAEEEAQVSQQEAMELRMALALDRQRERERRDKTRNLGAERRQQAEEAASRKKQLDELYRNEIGEEFFKFEKDAR